MAAGGCDHREAKDFTVLKRDLLELAQVSHIRYESSLLAPDEFVHATDRLANDYRLQHEPRPVKADAEIRRVVELCENLRSSATHHLNNDPQDRWWIQV